MGIDTPQSNLKGTPLRLFTKSYEGIGAVNRVLLSVGIGEKRYMEGLEFVHCSNKRRIGV